MTRVCIVGALCVYTTSPRGTVDLKVPRTYEYIAGPLAAAAAAARVYKKPLTGRLRL